MDEIKTATRTDGRFLYTFPKYKNPVTSLEQSIYVANEALELLEAETDEFGTIEAEAAEAMDVIHAAETYLRCIEKKHFVDLQEVYDYVLEKNQKRGYYNNGEAQ